MRFERWSISIWSRMLTTCSQQRLCEWCVLLRQGMQFKRCLSMSSPSHGRLLLTLTLLILVVPVVPTSVFIHSHSPTCLQSLIIIQCVDDSLTYVPGSNLLHSIFYCVTLLLRYSVLTSSHTARLYLSCHHICTVTLSMWNMMMSILLSPSCSALSASISAVSSPMSMVCTFCCAVSRTHRPMVVGVIITFLMDHPIPTHMTTMDIFSLLDMSMHVSGIES